VGHHRAILPEVIVIQWQPGSPEMIVRFVAVAWNALDAAELILKSQLHLGLRLRYAD